MYDTHDLLFIVLTTCWTFASCNIIVKTEYGSVRGIQTENARAFLGIPYAAPPVANLRWRPPVQPTPWKSVFDATSSKPACPQPMQTLYKRPKGVYPKTTSEDCLYVYVWTPLGATEASNLPVMFYIHGGAFESQSAGTELYNAEMVAKLGNIVVVSVDYRLGVLASLYVGDQPDDAKGNYGIKDQRQALLWTKNNIKFFGGNPDKVTISGQSAGGQSVTVHLTNRKADHLFQAAMIMSAPLPVRYKTKTEAKYQGIVLTELVGCKVGDMTCLRSKSYKDLIKAEVNHHAVIISLFYLTLIESTGLWIDGDEVPFTTMSGLETGHLAHKPIIQGATAEEAWVVAYYIKTQFDFKMLLVYFFAISPLHVLDTWLKYDPAQCIQTYDYRRTLEYVLTDLGFVCPARKTSIDAKKDGNPPTYSYIFAHGQRYPLWEYLKMCEGHSCHGADLPYMFHTQGYSGFNMTDRESQLSTEMIQYMANFVYTSDPNKGPHKMSLKWPKYTSSDSSTIVFNLPKTSLVPGYRKKYCDFWDKLGYVF